MKRSNAGLHWSLAKLAATFAAACALSACAPPGNAASEDKPLDEAALIENARIIHQQSLVLDAHADIVTPSTATNFLSADGFATTRGVSQRRACTLMDVARSALGYCSRLAAIRQGRDQIEVELKRLDGGSTQDRRARLCVRPDKTAHRRPRDHAEIYRAPRDPAQRSRLGVSSDS